MLAHMENKAYLKEKNNWKDDPYVLHETHL